MELNSASALSLRAISVGFDLPVDLSTVRPQAWLLTPLDGGEPARVVVAEFSDNRLSGTLTISPGLTSEKNYTVTALDAADDEGNAADPNENDVTAPQANPEELDWPEPFIRAWVDSVVEELDALNGRPTTLLLQDLIPGDTVALVETTLGFPDSGQFRAGRALFAYTGREAAALTGLTCLSPSEETLSARTVVECDVAALLPD